MKEEGILHSSKIINSVANSIKKINNNKVVLDPVMISKSGSLLISKDAIETLKKNFLSKLIY